MVKAIPRSAVGSIANKSLQLYVDKRIAPQRSAFIPNQVSSYYKFQIVNNTYIIIEFVKM